MIKKDSSTESWGKIEMSEEWIQMAQTSLHRIHFIMPFTFKQLGNVSDKVILDLGCGEGGYSRELTRKGATVTAVDCAESAIKYCVSKAEEEQSSHKRTGGNKCRHCLDAENTDIPFLGTEKINCPESARK